MKRAPRIVAIDGVHGGAVEQLARGLAARAPQRPKPGISRWDASGVFEELAVADRDAGTPGPRTMMLLYAADLAFRLRWEINPALEEGRMVVAAPYVETAVAFGVAAGLPAAWLRDLFGFAPAPAERHLASAPSARAFAGRTGFIEYACEHALVGARRRDVVRSARTHLLGSGAY